MIGAFLLKNKNTTKIEQTIMNIPIVNKTRVVYETELLLIGNHGKIGSLTLFRVKESRLLSDPNDIKMKKF